MSDTATNSVVKINVRGFTQNDTIRDNTFYETEIIGGLGGVRDNYSFNEPQVLQFYKDNLYVYDKGNLCIKVYDKDLGYVRNLRKSGFAKSNPPISTPSWTRSFSCTKSSYRSAASGFLPILTKAWERSMHQRTSSARFFLI